MKSQIISRTKGFLIGEAMIAFSLMTIFLTSAVVLSSSMSQLREVAIKKLDRMDFVHQNAASTTVYTKGIYGNHTELQSFEPITRTESKYNFAYGRETCNPRLVFDPRVYTLKTEFIDIGAGNMGTDLEVRNGIAYLTADSTVSILHDFYIIDTTAGVVLSSLNTGPGLSALEVAGPYVYAVNSGTTNQLQVIDISNRSFPNVVSRFKLPLPRASSSPPIATSIFYSRGFVYLGTEKWEGNEFSIIDVRDPGNPVYRGGFETNTQINNIYVHDNRAYVAASDVGQLRILDISNPEAVTQVSNFSPDGWETQVGRTLSYFENSLFLGRTTGGFNVTRNHELFLFSSTSDQVVSRDVAGGVYGIVVREPHVFIATRSLSHEFQVWNPTLNELVYEKALPFAPQALACDNNNFYFATGDRFGIASLTQPSP